MVHIFFPPFTVYTTLAYVGFWGKLVALRQRVNYCAREKLLLPTVGVTYGYCCWLTLPYSMYYQLPCWCYLLLGPLLTDTYLRHLPLPSR